MSRTFVKAKEIQASSLLLTYYNPKFGLIVAADASDYVIGAVLLHRFQDRSERAICQASRSLTDAEKKCSKVRSDQERRARARLCCPKIPSLPPRTTLHMVYLSTVQIDSSAG